MKKAHSIIGIDLGTTNCTLSYVPIEAADSEKLSPPIALLEIPQITAASTQGNLTHLPSFLYFPMPEELEAKLAALEWAEDRPFCVGHYARERGAELPHRMIGSAKSWLCHSGIDRRAQILPRPTLWGGDTETTGLMSPTEACAQLLVHLREAWEVAMKGKLPFEKQTVLVTVPASFDPSARQLVLEAASMAHYPEIILLEEPQAAFYAWLYRHQHDWRKQLRIGDTVLVVDVGGGTTDFSLISVGDDQGDLALRRVAVGSHLLLGGDNIDLALAYHARTKLEQEGHTLDDWQMQQLIHACRRSKERLFGETPEDSVDITLHGRGSRLIGSTLKTTLSKEEVERLVVDGFIPSVPAMERSLSEKRAGLQQVGLPFAQDPRISCQLAKFLSQTGESDSASMDRFIMPSAVLFNGGTMKGTVLRRRLMEVLNRWAEEMGQPSVKELPDPDYDHAVSQGAAYYGLSRQGKAVRIRGGTSRSYFVGVEGNVPAVPGMPAPLQAVCVVPYGMEEGSEQTLEGKEFALVLGEAATFRFFSRATPTLSSGETPAMGCTVRQWQRELTELHPIETLLDKQDDDGKTILVKLKSCVNELGILELWCVSREGRKWKLEFDLRASAESSYTT